MSARRGGPGVMATGLVQIVVLGVISAFLYFATRVVPSSSGPAGTIASVGYLLLAGTLTGELVDLVGLPHLTGYLLAGIVAGPHVLMLIDARSVKDLTSVNALALALIALEGGVQLRMATLRSGARSLGWATLAQSLLGLVCVALVFMALRRYIPFARGLAPAALVGAGLLWGTLAITRSPAATLGILAQTRARGPVMTGTLSFVLTSDVVVVVLLTTTMVIARPMINPSASFSLYDLTGLGHDSARFDGSWDHARARPRRLHAPRRQEASARVPRARLRHERPGHVPALRRPPGLHGRGVRRAEPVASG